MNEAETRAELIDPLLLAAGWGVVEGSRIRLLYADYLECARYPHQAAAGPGRKRFRSRSAG